MFSVGITLAALGCREVQEGGPRRKTPADAGMSKRVPTSCSELSCDEPAVCEVDDGTAHCVCPTGFEGDDGDCQDIDECAAAAMNDCGENARCENRAGSYECICNQGFGGDGRTCNALSDCSDETNTCHGDAICTSSDDGVSCSCATGFEGDGRTCRDVDECAAASAQCADHAHCVNQRGSFDCACDDLFEGDGRAQCRDGCQIARADAARCDARAGRCTFSSAGEAGCASCLPGYVGDGQRCVADSECAALGCGDNSVCAGEPGSRRCECADGFRDSPSSGCEDVDECGEASLCDAATSRCLNTPGGYVCACAQGYERVNGACVNIDECARGTDLCDASAECSDTSPGYECACKPGFSGDGFVCSDIDECEVLGDGACAKDGKATCQNTRGSYACVCPKGYAGDPNGEGCYCDLSGYWGLREDASFTVPEQGAGDVVILARSTTRATVWELKHYRYDGSKIVVETQQCGSSVPPEVYSPLYEEVYSSGIPNASYDKIGLQPAADMPLPRRDAQPGSTFNTPKFAALYGIKLDDPLNDPWPVTFRDVPQTAWVDSDGDGEPGITFWPEGTTKSTGRSDGETYDYLPVKLQNNSTLIDTRAGCVSVALRNINSLQGRIEACGRISGRLITDKIEARIHSCTLLRKDEWDTTDVTCSARDWSGARHCNEEHVEFLDEQDQTTESSGQFELVKIAEQGATGIDCATVRERLPALPRP